MVHLLSTRHRRQDSPFPFPSSYCKGNTVSNSALVKVGLYVLQEGLAWGNTVSKSALVKVGLYVLQEGLAWGNTVSKSALVKVGFYVLQEGLAWGNTVSKSALVKVGLYTLHIPRAQNPCYDQTQTTFLYSVQHQKCPLQITASTRNRSNEIL